jgi:hypothetical protein
MPLNFHRGEPGFGANEFAASAGVTAENERDWGQISHSWPRLAAEKPVETSNPGVLLPYIMDIQ